MIPLCDPIQFENNFLPSIESREALLSIAIKNNGTVTKYDNYLYTAINKELAEEFRFYALSLGYKAKILKVREKSNFVYKVYIKSKNAISVFDIGRRIINVEKVDYAETRCITVSDTSNLFITKDFIVTHNSWMLHLIACKYLDCKHYKGTMLRRTVPMLMKPGNLFDTGKKVFNQLPEGMKPKWKSGDRKLAVWEHGPVIEYSYLAQDKDLNNYQGSQMTTFFVDEAAQLEWHHLTYLFSRMRSDSKYKSRCVWSCNPDKNHMIRTLIDWWIDEDGFPIRERSGIERYLYVIDGFPQTADTAEELMERYPHMAKGANGDVIKPMSYSFISATIYDNPPLLKSNPGYLSALKGLEETERLKLLDGNWDVTVKGTTLFNREDLHKAVSVPFGSVCCRAWDKTASEPTEKNRYPDYTACIKMYKSPDGCFYIVGDPHESNHDALDENEYLHFRHRPGKRDAIIRHQAIHDGYECAIILPEDPGQAGHVEFVESAKKLAGFNVKKEASNPHKSKVKRFEPFASACENGLVYIVESSFKNKETLEAYYRDMEGFCGERSTRLRKDDFADVTASAYNYLAQEKVVPIVCRNQIKSDTKLRKI